MARLPDQHSAASGREAAHAIVINGAWVEARPAHLDIGWCRDTLRAMEPYSSGSVYVNLLHNDEDEARVRAACGKRYERLEKIKARYDPHDVFRNNQNIPPLAI